MSAKIRSSEVPSFSTRLYNKDAKSIQTDHNQDDLFFVFLFPSFSFFFLFVWAVKQISNFYSGRINCVLSRKLDAGEETLYMFKNTQKVISQPPSTIY